MTDELSPEKLAKLSSSELAEVSAEMKQRLQNEDWRKMLHDLQQSGHIHTFHDDAPPVLQRFLKLEIDLEQELARQSSGSPLMSTLRLDPRRPRGDERRLVALMESQDSGATMKVEVHPNYDTTAVSFSVGNMLTLRYALTRIDAEERQAFLEMARRDTGLCVLWTAERWQDDYIILVKGEFFSRLYAFSQHHEATARMSAEVVGSLTDWLERCWFPRDRGRRVKRTTQMLSALVVDPALAEGEASQLPDDKAAAKALAQAKLREIIEQLRGLDVPKQESLKTHLGGNAIMVDPILKGIQKNDPESDQNIVNLLLNQPELTKSINNALTKIATAVAAKEETSEHKAVDATGEQTNEAPTEPKRPDVAAETELPTSENEAEEDPFTW